MNSVNEKAPDIHDGSDGGSDGSSTCDSTRNTDDDTSTTRLMLDCMEHICHEIIQHPETAHDKSQELVVRTVFEKLTLSLQDQEPI
jgi:hypothetical protein